MFKSKLYKLYQTLNKQDLKQFKKWLCSPMHNEHQDVQQLFTFLWSRRSYTSMTLQKERLWKYLYSSKSYDDNHLRYIMSLSLTVLEKFVGYNLTHSDAFLHKKKLAEHFYQHKNVKAARKKLAESQKALVNQIPNEHFYYQQYALESLSFEIEGTQNRTRTTNLTNITTQSRLFFMLSTLRYACTARSHQSLRKAEYQIPLLDAILQEIKSNEYQEHPILMLYYYGYYTLKYPEEDQHFKILKDYVFSHPKLDSHSRKDGLLMGINYAIKQLNSGQPQYIREAFELYKYGLEKQYLLDNKELSLFAYSNTVALGLNLKEFDWVAAFIVTYSAYLPLHLQDNYKHYNTAKLEFERGNLDAAMQLLTQVEYNDLLLNIGAKVILLKIYYQEKHNDALDALLESFRVFLNRKKVLSYHKSNYTNLVNLTKRLLYYSPNSKELEQLKTEITNTNPLTEKQWLLEQLERL